MSERWASHKHDDGGRTSIQHKKDTTTLRQKCIAVSPGSQTKLCTSHLDIPTQPHVWPLREEQHQLVWLFEAHTILVLQPGFFKEISGKQQQSNTSSSLERGSGMQKAGAYLWISSIGNLQKRLRRDRSKEGSQGAVTDCFCTCGGIWCLFRHTQPVLLMVHQYV